MINTFLLLFKIGAIAFGGGAVILSLIQKEFVEGGIISASEFIRMLALSQATPGPIAGSAATYIGYKLYGVAGIILCNLAIALPSFLIVIIFSKMLQKHKESKVAGEMLKLLRPIMIALILSVIIFLAKMSIYNNSNISVLSDLYTKINPYGALIFLIAFITDMKYKINPIYIIIISGFLGAVIL